nr:PuroR-DsRed [Cloning vector pFastBac-CMV-ie1-pr]AZQ26978.1 PuroR-DsRed [Cloning vector pFastBac-ie1-OSKM]
MTEYKPTVRLATRDDVPRAVRTLAAAFADYPATRHTVDPDRHIERVTELQELFLTRVGLDIGKVWVADDGAAVAVWTTPESVEAGAVFAEIGPRMAELSGSRLAAQQQMEGLLAPHRPKEPAWFLATVGVSPDHQGKGLGSAVVLPGVEAAERAGVPAFLETSAPRNLPFYERLGFTVTADVEVPEGPRTWCMTRKPGATSRDPPVATMVRSSKNVIKEFMRFKVRMEGTVNGHEFEIEGEGEGRPYEGHNTVKLKVTKGGPLPFAWDILSPQFQYGSKVYVKHPADIPDYKKLSFPEGFKWERVMNFEDGGVVTVTQDSSLQDGCFIYKVKFIGVNFPSDGPVMQKKTMGWEASTERLYPRDGVLKGEIHKALKLKDGGHYLVEFKSIYMAKKPVQLPGYYYVDSKLDITSHNEDYTIVEQYERTEGRHHLFL